MIVRYLLSRYMFLTVCSQLHSPWQSASSFRNHAVSSSDMAWPHGGTVVCTLQVTCQQKHSKRVVI